MKLINIARKKSKTNPKQICFSCGKKIKNKFRNSKYCKGCGKIINMVNQKLGCYTHYIKNRYCPGYDLKYKFTVTKRK